MPDTIKSVELDIEGMTCTSCANRIEKKLNKLDGVVASVNFATEKAKIEFPNVISEHDLIKTVENTGYKAHKPVLAHQDHEGKHEHDTEIAEPHDHMNHGTHSLKELRWRFVLSMWLAIPVILISMVPHLQFNYWQWAALTLTTPVVFYCGWEFHEAAWKQIKHKSVSMDTLISMGTLAAYFWSIYALFIGHAGMEGMKHTFHFSLQVSDGNGNIYLEAAAGVTMFLLAGRYFEMKTKREAGSALKSLLNLAAKQVRVLREVKGYTIEQEIPVEELDKGEHFIVKPGEKIATDGVIVKGHSTIDTSMLTGENVPKEVEPGAEVVGAMLNVNGVIEVKATAVGGDTKLAHIAQMVQDAQAGKARIQKLADKVSEYFVPAVISLAFLTFILWVIFGSSMSLAFTAAVAVLIIACPCALGLATPIALMMGTGRGAELGILMKGPEVLESSSDIDTIALDKTGTITSGQMQLSDVIPTTNESSDKLLAVAGALEDFSEHPIAQAIATAAKARGELAEVTNFKNIVGFGVKGEIDDVEVYVGTEKLLKQAGQTLGTDLNKQKTKLELNGKTVVNVAWNGKVRGLIAVSDTLKESSKEAVAKLQELGLDAVLLTGDNKNAANYMAEKVGIKTVIAEVLPEDKRDVVRRLQSEGKKVAMVGDGINDAVALAQADLGIAIGTGADAAIAASDITLVSGDLLEVADAIKLAKKTFKTIKANLFWAFAYNILALPLAAFGLLNPMIAGAAMAFSSVAVVLNSLRLRYFAKV
ncbi:MAG: heavy metal translocating P-type ATPase [Micrococcaceae bacterium]